MGFKDRITSVALTSEEIEAAVFSFFQSSRSDIDTITYAKDDKECFQIRFNRYGIIEGMEFLDSESVYMEDELVDWIKNADEDAGFDIVRKFVFFRHPVVGSYRFRDLFQLLPLPGTAPRPSYALGKHPALIEVKVRSSNNQIIKTSRGIKGVRDIEYLLAFFIFGFFAGTNDVTDFVWVLDDLDAEMKPRFLQTGYNAGGIDFTQKDFSFDESVPPIEIVGWKQYYESENAIYLGENQKVPDNLRDSIGGFMEFREEIKDNFLRSCFWISKSQQVYSISKSLSYNCLISAIESLYKIQGGAPCTSCGKPTGDGPTKAFKDFVETYCPGAISLKERDRIYKIRSKIAHGEDVLATDRHRFAPTFNQMKEDRIHRSVSRLTFAVIYNWFQVQKLQSLDRPR